MFKYLSMAKSCLYISIKLILEMVSQTVESNDQAITIALTVWKRVLNLWKTLCSRSIFV